MKKFFFAKRRKLTWPLWVAFVIILLYALTLLTPLYYMLINSFKRVDDFLLNGCWKMPKAVHWQNFEDAIQLTSGKVSFVQKDFVGRPFHGPGDLFASVLTGALVKGKNLHDAADQAAEFVKLCVAHTAPQNTPDREGVDFEPMLHHLFERNEL